MGFLAAKEEKVNPEAVEAGRISPTSNDAPFGDHIFGVLLFPPSLHVMEFRLV